MPQRGFQAGLKAVGFAGAGDGSCSETPLRKLHKKDIPAPVTHWIRLIPP